MAEAKKETKTEEKSSKSDDNVIYVGKKPTMSYVLAVITQFSEGMKEVFLKARGRSISRAVDVVEVVKNKFVPDIKYDIDIGTEEIEDDKNRRLNVSTISIRLTK